MIYIFLFNNSTLKNDLTFFYINLGKMSFLFWRFARHDKKQVFFNNHCLLNLIFQYHLSIHCILKTAIIIHSMTYKDFIYQKIIIFIFHIIPTWFLKYFTILLTFNSFFFQIFNINFNLFLNLCCFYFYLTNLQLLR